MARTYQKRRTCCGTPLKQRFVKLLRELLKRNGIQQKDLVRRLGVTASAASQIFSGALIPSQARVDQLFEILKPEVHEAQLLQDMAFWLRSGRKEMPSCANRKLFFLRCRSGLPAADVARLSGIAPQRLDALENQPGAVPGVDELAALTAVLGGDGPGIAAHGVQEDVAYAEAADGGGVAMLPRIGAKELRDYDGRERITDFSSRHATGFAKCAGVSAQAAAVCVVPATEVGFGGSGTLKMILSEAAPPELEKISLCADASGKLFIRGGLLDAAPDARRQAEWSIPLLEISYAPGRNKKI